MTNSASKISGGVPDFMKASSQQWLAEQMREDPEFYINRAMFAANDLTVDRMIMVEDAQSINSISTLAQWKAETEIYPKEPLTKGSLNRTANPDRPFRAFYLIEAISKLLALVDAPASMESDVRLLIQASLPRRAERRAEIQKALIDHPTWSDTKIAATYKYDLTGMRKEIEAGQLRRCPVADES